MFLGGPHPVFGVVAEVYVADDFLVIWASFLEVGVCCAFAFVRGLSRSLKVVGHVLLGYGTE